MSTPQEAVAAKPEDVIVINTPDKAVPVSGTIQVGNFPGFPSSHTVAKQNWEYTIIELTAAHPRPSRNSINLKVKDGNMWGSHTAGQRSNARANNLGSFHSKALSFIRR
jgi:hypothetical protein